MEENPVEPLPNPTCLRQGSGQTRPAGPWARLAWVLILLQASTPTRQHYLGVRTRAKNRGSRMLENSNDVSCYWIICHCILLCFTINLCVHRIFMYSCGIPVWISVTHQQALSPNRGKRSGRGLLQKRSCERSTRIHKLLELRGNITRAKAHASLYKVCLKD